MNIINLKIRNTQYYLDCGVALALFKEIQALGWLNFVTDANRCVQKIEEPKKPLQTNQTVAKILVRFRFYYIKTENFDSVFGGRFECTKLIELNRNILLYYILY